MKLEPGAQVAGKYRLDERLGVGGMGEVWSATQLVTRKAVALKFLRDGPDADTKRRFLREARAACAVRHPNVVQVHDVLELEDGEPVLVMELLVGESLETRLRREGRLALGDLAAALVRVVSAVGAAHAVGIVHRDLKPDNIFLAQTPDGIEVKVLDFGIAKLTAIDGDAALTGGLTNTGAMLGTPFYMSPEQAFGEKKIDHRSDIWSLGIILYRGLSGVLPTRADNIGQILKIIMTDAIPPLRDAVPGVPADLDAVVGRMLSHDQAKRPSDLREVKEVLERYAGVEVEPFAAPAPTPSDDVDTVAGVAQSTPARAAAAGTAARDAAQSSSAAGAAASSASAAVAATGAPGRARPGWVFAVAVGVLAIAAFAVVRTLTAPGAAKPEPTVASTAPSASTPETPSASIALAAAAAASASAASSASASAGVEAETPTPASPSVSASAAASVPRTPVRGPRSGATHAPNTPAPQKTSVGGVVTDPPF